MNTDKVARLKVVAGPETAFPVRWLAVGLVLTTVVLLTMLWSLLAHSDGVGLGATFTLELPLSPAEVFA
jgi:hypothetical protein